MCVAIIIITSKQIIAETPNFTFYLCIRCRRYMKRFTKIRRIVRVRGHTKEFETLRLMDLISCKCIWMYLDCAKHDEKKTYFRHDQKHKINQFGLKSIYNISTGPHRNFIYISSYFWKRLTILWQWSYVFFK